MRSRKDLHRNARKAALTALATVFLGSFVGSTALAGPWAEHMQKIPALKRQTEDLEGEIKHLIEEKRETDDDAKVRQLTLEIAEKYKALREAGEKLEAETTHVRFKHPEQASQLDRKYVRFKVKSMRDLESEVGIDGRLDRIKKQVMEIFPIPHAETAKSEEPKISPYLRKPASVEVDDDVPEKIVLKK